MKSLYENALNRLELWINSIRTDEGYHGPAIGPRSTQLGCCLAGFDWRYEGLLNSWINLHKSTGKAKYLKRIQEDLNQITAAQLLNGTFRNSHFSEGPFEGGMPHEPAMLTAAVKAAVYLEANEYGNTREIQECVRKYVDTYLISHLWNKLLKTFNNWPFSEFEKYSPYCVAAAVELIYDFGTWQNNLDDYESYIVAAVESMIKVQCSNGNCLGAFPTLSSHTKGFVPLYTARCFRALKIAYLVTNDDRYMDSFEKAKAYVRNSALEDGGFYRLTYNDREPIAYPIMIGAVAGILESFNRVDELEEAELNLHLSLILKEQLPSGAFATAIGFNRAKRPKDADFRDYRDLFPVCAWNDKVFHLLTTVANGDIMCKSSIKANLQVKINGRIGTYVETPHDITLMDNKNQVVYQWLKKNSWPLKIAL